MTLDENNAVMRTNKIGDSGRYKRARCGSKAWSFGGRAPAVHLSVVYVYI